MIVRFSENYRGKEYIGAYGATSSLRMMIYHSSESLDEYDITSLISALITRKPDGVISILISSPPQQRAVGPITNNYYLFSSSEEAKDDDRQYVLDKLNEINSTTIRCYHKIPESLESFLPLLFDDIENGTSGVIFAHRVDDRIHQRPVG